MAGVDIRLASVAQTARRGTLQKALRKGKRAGMHRLSALFVLLAAPAAWAAPRLYVSNEDGGDVAVIDTGSDTVVTTIPVGKRPRGVKLSPDGKLLYVALSGSPRGGPGVDESKLPPPDRAADGIGVVDLKAGKL